MEHAIGEIVTLPDGRKAKVVESDRSCNECMMAEKRLCRYMNVRCKSSERYLIDRKNIIYKEIKED